MEGSMKYALIKNNKVEVISYEPTEGYVEVNDNVYADMVKKPNGSFDYSDEFKAEHIKLNTYADKRLNEYPDFKEYLDGIVKGDDAQIQKYINDCLAVKAKYPKE
jgi:hypothetical protein